MNTQIPVLDHLILADDGALLSMAESGQLVSEEQLERERP